MRITRVDQVHTYEAAFEAAMEIFNYSREWPREEAYALTDQARRSSRSVCANLSEAWAKRRYPDHFVSKLTDAHGEAEETLTWLHFAERCGYLGHEPVERLGAEYHRIIGGILRMANSPSKWCLPNKRPSR